MFRSVDGLIMWLFAVMAAIVIACIAAHEIRPSDDGLHRLGTWSIALGFASAFIFPVLVSYPAVVLSTDGLALSRFGIRSSSLRWDELKMVRFYDVTGKGIRGRHYALFTAASERRDRLVFRSDYADVDDLIAVVQAEVTRRGVPVFGLHLERWVPMGRLPPSGTR